MAPKAQPVVKEEPKPAVIDTTGKVVDRPTQESRSLALPNAPEAALDVFRGGGGGSDENRVSLPRIAVLQPMSSEVNKTEDPEPRGTMFNRLTKENLGKKFAFIALGKYTTRVRFVQNVGLACRSIDTFVAQLPGGMTYDGHTTQDCTECKLKDWPKDRIAKGDKEINPEKVKSPECSINYNYPALLIRPDEDPAEAELIVLTMGRTSSQAGRDLNGMQLGSAAPWQNFVYEVGLGQGSAPNGTPYWFQTVKRLRKSTEAERAKAIQTLSFLAGKQVIVNDEDDESTIGTQDPQQQAAAAAAAGAETRF